MVTEPSWGRIHRRKQESLPLRANDRCGDMDWSRHPAWTESMRAALKTRQESGGKWFSLIDRMWDPRLLQAAWERLNRRVTGEKRHSAPIATRAMPFRCNRRPCSGEPCAGKLPARFGGRGG